MCSFLAPFAKWFLYVRFSGRVELGHKASLTQIVKKKRMRVGVDGQSRASISLACIVSKENKKLPSH
jgi:hypothetical protein